MYTSGKWNSFALNFCRKCLGKTFSFLPTSIIPRLASRGSNSGGKKICDLIVPVAMLEASAAMARRNRRQTRKQTKTQAPANKKQTKHKRQTQQQRYSRENENWERRARADLGERPGLESYMHEAVGWGWGLQPA